MATVNDQRAINHFKRFTHLGIGAEEENMAIRFDRFTVKAQEAVQRAQQLAQEHNHQLLEPLHLLAALLTEEQGFVRDLLNKVGTNVEQLTKTLELRLRDIPEITGGDGQIHISSAMSRVLEAAQEFAGQMNANGLSIDLGHRLTFGWLI